MCVRPLATVARLRLRNSHTLPPLNSLLTQLCVWHRRRRLISRAERGKKEHKAAAKAAKAAAKQQQNEGTQQQESEGQFMTAPEAAAKLADTAADKAGAAAAPVQRRKLTAGRVLKWLVVLLGLATMGVSAWGLAESITATDGLVDDFWRLVDGARGGGRC